MGGVGSAKEKRKLKDRLESFFRKQKREKSYQKRGVGLKGENDTAKTSWSDTIDQGGHSKRGGTPEGPEEDRGEV